MSLAKTCILACIAGILVLERPTEAGYCYRSYSCSASSHRSTSYTTACGLFNWSRCKRYRGVYYKSYRTCTSSYCCPGYTGSSCSQPMCHGSMSCPNSGTCTAPDRCICSPGFSGSNCTDTNECQTGTHNCQQLCSNTFGSFTCSCRSGYTLQNDKTTCTDNDECLSNNGGCSQYCRNLDGSYECYCKDGLIVADDKKTCIDRDECVDNNGDCKHTCVNEYGTYRCECNEGFQLDEDGKTCTDMDECKGLSKCSQFCHNTNGSYACSCKPGYELDVDGHTCLNIDDCIGISCLNDGICIDGTESYSCKCDQGFEGKRCETDINECLFANGGCEDQCVNTDGSLYCQCRNGTFLEDDGVSCRGDSSRPTVFDTYNISRRLLPRGCAVIPLASCKGVGTGSQIELTSTSPWYQLKTNQSILYTFGIIFVEINDLSIPVSATGMTVISTLLNFELITGSSKYSKVDGIVQKEYYKKDCLMFEITPKDVHDFVTSGSFLGTMFDKINVELPTWLQFSKLGVGMISVTDLKNDLVVGSKIDSFHGCKGAPVLNDRLYSVFSFGADMSFNIYGKRFNIPPPLAGNKFCLIVDICQNNGGTVFLMLPPESRRLLDDMDLFTTTLKGLKIRPKGIGVSLSKDINVHYKTSEMTLWNGDQIFRYPVFPRGSVWFGTDIEYDLKEEDFSLQFNGETDIFLRVPNLSSLLLDIFVEEWNSVVQVKRLTFTPTIQFQVFGKTVQVTFKEIAVGSIDIYLSVGGVEERTWCGDEANPPGIFASLLADENPFKSIPIIGDWDFPLSSKIYGFITTEEQLSITTDINVIDEIVELKDMCQRLIILLTHFIIEFGDKLASEIKETLSDLSNALTSINISLNDVVIGETHVKNVLNIWRNIWNIFSNEVKKSATRLSDMLEFESSMIANNLEKILEREVSRIGLRIDSSISRIRNQILSLVNKYTGFGFRFTAFVKIYLLDFWSMDIEIVKSIDQLGKCSKFQKVFEIMNEQQSYKVLLRATVRKKIGYFFLFEKGVYLSLAMNTKYDKFIGHIHIHVSILGMKVSGDLLISNSGIFINIEGDIWNVFFAKLEISAALGKKWHDLSFNVKGALVVSDKKKLTTNSLRSDFEGSYLDGIRRLAQQIADNANNRLQAAQNRLSAAQKVLTSAQNKITNAQGYVRSCNSKFDDAINGLEYAKNKLDEAKAPYKEALKRIRQAQRNVDNLCKIKKCNPICMPGVRWSTCNGWWGGYPCLKWTSCMLKLPNVLCEAANVACWAIRFAAYAALEAAKIFVRLPMVAYDLASAALSVTQVVVDKSRTILLVAEGLLEIAKFGLEVAKGGLEIAKLGIEMVKFTVRAALYVFNLLVSGLQKLIDVRNCGFEIQMSTDDRAFFDVTCDVQAFDLGWKTFRFEFDFRHPITSMLQIAKTTMTSLLDSITNILDKRKKRDIPFLAASKLHYIISRYKRENVNETYLHSMFLNTSSLKRDVADDLDTKKSYDDRVLLFKKNCDLFQNVHSFLIQSIDMLIGMCNETVAIMSAQKTVVPLTVNSPLNNMTAESLGISREYALQDYNITSDDLDGVLEEVKSSLLDDPIMKELDNSSKEAGEQIAMQIAEANSIHISEYWLSGMENQTGNFFEERECSNFEDCILYALSILYDLFSDESLSNAAFNRELTSSIENDFLLLILNSTITVTSVYELATDMKDDLTNLNTSHLFCSTAPEITIVLSNKTVLVKSNIAIHCGSTGNPVPHISWYHNDEVLVGKNESKLELTNVSKNHEGTYRCRVENVVAEVSSEEAFVTIKECQPGTYFNSSACLKCSKGQYQHEWNKRTCNECPIGYTTTDMGSKSENGCYDIDECMQHISGCEHVCINTNGSFICECTSGFTLKNDAKSCSGAQRFIVPISAGIMSGVVVIMIIVLILHIKSKHMNNKKKRSSTAPSQERSFDPMFLMEKMDPANEPKMAENPTIYSTVVKN